MGRVVFLQTGRIVQEDVNFIHRYPSEDGGERLTFLLRTDFTWPADKTPIVFPDDLDSYPIFAEE